MADKVYFPGWRLSPDGKEYRLFDRAEDVPDGWLRETPESFAKNNGDTVVLLATDGNEHPVQSPIKIDENLAGSEAERNIAPVAAPKPRGRPKKSLDL